MPIDPKLLEILVCPKCKGSLTQVEAGLVCNACQLKYPIRDDIPVMLVEEAVSLKSAPRDASAGAGRISSFRVIDGPNKGFAFQLEHGTCKAIGREITDPNRTAMFHMGVSLALDEGTKGLVLKYVTRQFSKKTAEGKTEDNELGGFQRTSDIVVDDPSVSRLHAMVFYDVVGTGVLDLVSKNGTFVNGEEVESRLLNKGDIMELGETKIQFEG